MKRLALAAGLLLIPLQGFGQEVILTPEREPQASSDYDKRKEMGDWARGILDRAASGEPAPPEVDEPGARGCRPPSDRRPHGVVWGTVGTDGYSDVGVIVTQPIGDCGSATVAVSRTENGRAHRRKR